MVLPRSKMNSAKLLLTLTHLYVFLLHCEPIHPQTTRSSTTTIRPYPSRITVYVVPSAGSEIDVICWSNNTRFSGSTDVVHNQTYTTAGEISWRVPENYYSTFYDMFWCRARSGNRFITQFAVYGDDVERGSSEWIIDAQGKRRLSLDITATNDKRGSWRGTDTLKK